MHNQMKDLLEERDWQGADLSGQSLGGLDLSGKNFRGADFSNAHLGGANLRGTDLRNANLQHANLGAANLRGADLRYADLRGANLAGADTAGTDFREAQGLKDSEATLDLPNLELEITEDYHAAEADGFLPIAHWGRAYRLAESNKTLYRNNTAWNEFKKQMGDVIFSDRKAYREVRLVKQYKQVSQWAYMISRKGFEQVAARIGLRLKDKP